MGQTITASFGLDINPLKKGWNSAIGISKSAVRSIGSHITGFLTTPLAGISAAVGAFFTYETFKSGIEGVIDAGTEMEKLHKQTGMAVGSIATLKGIFHSADASAERLGDNIGLRQRNLFQAARTGGPAGSALRMLKLDIDELVKEKPEDQFVTIGKAINGLPSPLARASASMTLFGKSGVDLLPVFSELENVDFGNLSQKAAIMEKDAERFHQVTVSFRRARGQLQNVFVGMADSLSPSLLALGTLLSKRNALDFGVALGNGIRTATQVFLGAFQNPTLLADTVAQGLSMGYAIAGNYLAAGYMKSGAAFTEALLTGVDIVVRALRAGLQKAVEYALGGVKITLEDAVSGMGDIGKKLGIDKALLGLASGLPEGKGTFKDYYDQQESTGFSKAAGIADIFRTSEVADLFGAAKFGEMAKASAAKLRATGEPILQAMEDLGKKAEKLPGLPGLSHLTNNGGLIGASMALGMNAFSERFSAGFNARVVNRDGTTNEVGALTKGADAQSPLLSVAERRAFEDQAVARGNVRTAGLGAYGAVRSGDRQRRKEVEKERLRQKEGQEKSNELLEGILVTVMEGLLDG